MLGEYPKYQLGTTSGQLLTLSYIRSLTNILKAKDPELFARLTRIEENSKRVLTYTAAGFPFFTPHDFQHSKKVEDNLNWLIPDDVKPRLNAQEIFFVIVAAWLHDWGMVCSAGETPEIVRPNHHVRTEANFEKMYNLVGLDRTEARIVGRIARGHRVENLRGRLFDDQVFGTNIQVRVRFLSAILRLADECDITYNRVPELVYYSLNPQGASKEHFDKHLNVGGIGKGRHDEHKIVFNAVAWDPKGAETLRVLRNKIQKELDEIRGILADEQVPWEFVEANIDAKGFIDKPISFRLDQTNVTQILIGEALYSRKDVAIRELLQNSVDSCRLQKNLHPKKNISIRIYRDGNKLVVEDDGAGMDFEDAFEFLSNKGLSYYKSEEFKTLQKTLDFEPISRWGLGILSCFLIASEFDIETKKEGKDACRFMIKDVREGWRYEQGQLGSPGTRIVLTLNDYGMGLDLEKTIRYYLKEIEIPVFLGKGSQQSLVFDWTCDDEIIQSHIDQCLSEILYSSTQVERPRIISQQAFTTNNLRIRFFQFSHFLTRSALFIANQGFFVREFDRHGMLRLPQNSIMLVNTLRDVLDLDVSRENLRTNTLGFELFRDELTGILIELFKKDLEEHVKKDPGPKMSELQQAVMLHSLLSSRSLDPEEFSEDGYTLIPRPYKDFLSKLVPLPTVSSKGLRVATLAEVVAESPQAVNLCIVNPIDVSLLEDHVEVLSSGIELASSILKNNLQEKEIAIFAFGHWIEQPESFFTNLLRDLGSNCSVNHAIQFDDLVSNMNLTINETPLDSLLPLGSHFATFPSQLRGGVICTRPFFVRAPRSLEDPFGGKIPRLVARKVLELSPKGEMAKLQILEMGTFMFDSEEAFCKRLIENSERILSNQALAELVTNYFRFLATALLTGLDSFEILEAREREMSKLIGIKDLPTSKRALLFRLMMRGPTPLRTSKLIRIEYEAGTQRPQEMTIARVRHKADS